MQHRIIHLTTNIRHCLTLLHSVFETHDMLNNFRAYHTNDFTYWLNDVNSTLEHGLSKLQVFCQNKKFITDNSNIYQNYLKCCKCSGNIHSTFYQSMLFIKRELLILMDDLNYFQLDHNETTYNDFIYIQRFKSFIIDFNYFFTMFF